MRSTRSSRSRSRASGSFAAYAPLFDGGAGRRRFGFPGAFVARLRAVEGAAVVEGAPPGLAGRFEGLADGAYVLEVDEDPAEAVASVAVVAAAAPDNPTGRTRAAHEVTATLRGLAPDQLSGAEYDRLREARDVEDVLFGSG